ncbi:MAG: CpaF family protein [bacterium]|nr:CpaF family protein [bacterium]
MMISDELLEQITKKVSLQLEGQRDISDETIKNTAYQMLEEVTNHEYVSISEKMRVVGHCLNVMKKLGLLQPILDDKSVTEIMINGPQHIFVERAGHLYELEEHFESDKQLEDIIQKIVSKVNRTVDSSNPICDARLEDGSRVNIVLPPIALCGATVTIRKFPEKVIQFQDLINWGAITKEAADFLKKCVQAKYNIFVSGGTGSGKTTFLNALSNFIPSDERIITIEDSAELQIQSVKNLVRLETRNANTEGKGAITIRDLIKSSLRMRPERIVVGEVRGAEALDMLQAMNTGHDGSLSTGHANSPEDMLSRLETMVLTGSSFPIEAIRQQIASAIDIIVHLGRMSDKSRKTLYIVELLGYENGKYKINPVFTFELKEDSTPNHVRGRLERTKNPFYNMHKFTMAGIPCEEINRGITGC